MKDIQKNKFPLLFYAQPYQFDKNNKGAAYTFVSIRRYSFTTNVHSLNTKWEFSNNGEFLNKWLLGPFYIPHKNFSGNFFQKNKLKF